MSKKLKEQKLHRLCIKMAVKSNAANVIDRADDIFMYVTGGIENMKQPSEEEKMFIAQFTANHFNFNQTQQEKQSEFERRKKITMREWSEYGEEVAIRYLNFIETKEYKASGLSLTLSGFMDIGGFGAVQEYLTFLGVGE